MEKPLNGAKLRHEGDNLMSFEDNFHKEVKMQSVKNYPIVLTQILSDFSVSSSESHKEV